MTRLSINFTLRELTKSNTALRHGLDNTPDPMGVTVNLVRVAQYILQPVRDNFGIPFSPSSGYRSLELNRLIGSKDTSQHVKGQAVDFEIPGVSNQELAEWIKDNLNFDQLILEFHNPENPSSGWVHCSYVGPECNRNQSLIFDGNKYRKF